MLDSGAGNRGHSLDWMQTFYNILVKETANVQVALCTGAIVVGKAAGINPIGLWVNSRALNDNWLTAFYPWSNIATILVLESDEGKTLSPAVALGGPLIER